MIRRTLTRAIYTAFLYFFLLFFFLSFVFPLFPFLYNAIVPLFGANNRFLCRENVILIRTRSTFTSPHFSRPKCSRAFYIRAKPTGETISIETDILEMYFPADESNFCDPWKQARCKRRPRKFSFFDCFAQRKDKLSDMLSILYLFLISVNYPFGFLLPVFLHEKIVAKQVRLFSFKIQ